MTHLRGSGLAILVVLLLAGAVLAAGDQIADLENKVAKMEAMLKEEPAELRPMIARGLAAARRELRQALQDRFDLLSQMAATTPDEQKAKTERLEKLRSRIDELNGQLAEPAPGAQPAQPSTAQPPTAATRAPAAPGQPTAPTKTPAPEATDASKKKTEVEVKPEFDFTETAVLPKSVRLRVDISREWKDADVEKKCSNKPYSHSAKVWKLMVIADPLWDGKELKPRSYFIDAKQNLFIPVASLAQKPNISLAIGARAYVGHAVRFVREVALEFDGLSLAELSDVADYLANHPEEIQKAYREVVARYEVFQVAFWHEPDQTVDKGELYNVLTCNMDPMKQPDIFHDTLVSAEQIIKLETCIDRTDPDRPRTQGIPVYVKANAPFNLTARIWSARLDAESIKTAKQMVKGLINNQAETWSTDAALQKNNKATEDVNKKDGNAAPALIIDDPCFQLSTAPLLSGSEFKPAVTFRFRYDYYTADDKFTIKLRAEGDGAEGGQYFQRIKIGSEGTGLFARGDKGWQVAGGFEGHYSFTRNSGAQVDEWQAGGKLQVQTPFVRLFETHAGANARPTFSVEGAAAGGNGSTTKTTDFQLTTNFLYTLRPNARASLDLKAEGGWSNHVRFASEKTYSHFQIQGRYNLGNSWDYVVRYECGQKDPDYRKFCGWQTGLVLVTGR